MALSNLNDFHEFFLDEALIINHVKCNLLRNEDIEDFYINENYINVYKNSEGYDIYYKNRRISITVYEKMIVDMVVD